MVFFHDDNQIEPLEVVARNLASAMISDIDPPRTCYLDRPPVGRLTNVEVGGACGLNGTFDAKSPENISHDARGNWGSADVAQADE